MLSLENKKIYYSHQRKKEAQKEAEAIERMQIREYGKKINDKFRNKHR